MSNENHFRHFVLNISRESANESGYQSELRFILQQHCYHSPSAYVPVKNYRSSMDYLNALASVCEAAQRISVPPNLPPSVNVYNFDVPFPRRTPSPPLFTTSQAFPSYYSSGCTTIPGRMAIETIETSASLSKTPHIPGYSVAPVSVSTVQHIPYQINSQSAPAGVGIVPHPTALFPSPPPTPDSTTGQFQPLPPPQAYPNAHLNPVLKNVLAYAQFQHYLDETWPEASLRRGSAVIRASLYSKIADVLQGGEATARFRHWVKKTEFFVIERTQPGIGYGACLGIPVVKSRGSKSACKGTSAGGERHSTYKLVARLEDFVYIIGNYHNNQRGHPGIRRTYAMVSFIARFVPMCFHNVFKVMVMITP